MLFLPIILVIAGLVVGIALLVRPTRSPRDRLEANAMVPRITADVHAGEEQVLIHLARSLELATGRDQVGYGQIYIAGSAGMVMRLASRSEIGRGFDGEIRVRRTRRSTIAEYFVLRLPGDEAVNARIAALDADIVSALRALDAAAQIQAVTEPTAAPRRFLTTRA